MGLRLSDLKELEYKDVAKIMLCFLEKDENRPRRATQTDINNFLG